MKDAVLRESSRIYETIVQDVLHLRQRGDLEGALRRIQMAAKFAWLMPTGRYADGRLENVALEIGHELDRILPRANPQGHTLQRPTLPADRRRKVLHVATTVNDVGGHTRLIANWIRNDRESCHSVVITATWINQGRSVIPDWLEGAVAGSGGSLVRLPSDGVVTRAHRLREIVQANVDMVMLHHHPSDVVPILAFAVAWCPPVAIVDQAAHLFWLGSSVADVVIDDTPTAKWLSENRRFIPRSLHLPMPLDTQSPRMTREQARAQLRLPEDQVMLLSVGSAYKYIPTDTHNFYRAAGMVLSKNPEAHLYIVGVDWDESKEYLRQAKHERLHFVGVIADPDVYQSYQRAADLYLEGFPIGSNTALLEAGLAGVCPVLSFGVTSPILASEDVALRGTIDRASSEKEYVETVGALIRDKEQRERRGDLVRARVVECHSIEEWNRHLSVIYRCLEETPHTPHRIPDARSIEGQDDVSLSRVSRLLNDPESLWTWMSMLDAALGDIDAVIPRGETLILVDEDDWGSEDFLCGRCCVPFLERDGRYWGAPEDDEAAIREVHRLRQGGANFMVFAWPAYWWLDHYSGLQAHLRSHFACVLENDRVVVFDLRR